MCDGRVLAVVHSLSLSEKLTKEQLSSTNQHNMCWDGWMTINFTWCPVFIKIPVSHVEVG